MKINSEMSLVPFFKSVQPVQSVSERDIEHYSNQREAFVRTSARGSAYRRPANIYGRLGDEKRHHSAVGGNIDMYV